VRACVRAARAAPAEAALAALPSRPREAGTGSGLGWAARISHRSTASEPGAASEAEAGVSHEEAAGDRQEASCDTFDALADEFQSAHEEQLGAALWSRGLGAERPRGAARCGFVVSGSGRSRVRAGLRWARPGAPRGRAGAGYAPYRSLHRCPVHLLRLPDPEMWSPGGARSMHQQPRRPMPVPHPPPPPPTHPPRPPPPPPPQRTWGRSATGAAPLRCATCTWCWSCATRALCTRRSLEAPSTPGASPSW
jgi:hypothetical protein